MKKYLVKGIVYFNLVFVSEKETMTRARHHIVERNTTADTPEEAIEATRLAVEKRYNKKRGNIHAENFEFKVTELYELVQII